MKNLLLTNWHLMRWIRLAFAIFLFSQAYTTKEWIFAFFGVFLFIQVIFNTGCGPNGCAVPYSKK